MSDGHFNRAFLPHGSFASGVRVGRASARALCATVFAEMLTEIAPHLSPDEQAQMVAKFKQTVAEREK